MDSFPPSPRLDFKYKYPGAPEDALDFLNKILVFNPYFRMTLDDALSHPMFKNVRRPQAEAYLGKPIELEFEKLDLDVPMLRKLILEEIMHYH